MKHSALLWEDAKTVDMSIEALRRVRVAVVALAKSGEPLSSAAAHLLAETLKVLDKSILDLERFAGDADTIYPEPEPEKPFTAAWFKQAGILPTVGGHEVV